MSVFVSNAGNDGSLSERLAGLELPSEEPLPRLLVLMESRDESLSCRFHEPEPIPDELLGLFDVVLGGELCIALLPLEEEELLDAGAGELVVVVWEGGGGAGVGAAVGECCAKTTGVTNRRAATKLYIRIEHLPGNSNEQRLF